MTLAYLFTFFSHRDEDRPRAAQRRREESTASVPAGPDDALIERIRAGDDGAFAHVFRVHFVHLVTFVASYLGDEEEAKEVVAELFMWVYRHRDQWKAPVGIRAYLFRAARNRASNRLRDQRRLDRRAAEHYVDLADPDASDLGRAPDMLLIAREDAEREAEAIRRAFDALTPKAREVASLRWRDGLSTQEIAAALDMSPAAVLMQVSRALKTLRDRLPEYLR